MIGCVCSSAEASGAAVPRIWFQAHRGGVDEVPENTLAAFRHAWSVEGAVPEADVRTTRDGVMVCLHDDTPARTTDAPDASRDKEIGEITFDEVRRWDAGVKFAPQFAGQKVPRIEEVFDEMKGHPDRLLYLDLKGVDLDALKALIDEYNLSGQLLFVHGSQEGCIEVTRMFPGARTMTWLSGSPEEIRQRFEAMVASGFDGISQLQFHLRVRRRRPEIIYVLDGAFLADAHKRLTAAGVDLQLRPFDFDGPSLRKLTDLGVRWFVTDAPAKFAGCVREAREVNSKPAQ